MKMISTAERALQAAKREDWRKEHDFFVKNWNSGIKIGRISKQPILIALFKREQYRKE